MAKKTRRVIKAPNQPKPRSDPAVTVALCTLAGTFLSALAQVIVALIQRH